MTKQLDYSRMVWVPIQYIALCCGVSKRTIQRMIADGKFEPAEKLMNRTPVWRKTKLDEWIHYGKHLD
ncbi:hypothetical protein FACS1894189_3510 [Planctomycetales bacterium]|nr:hypothetical protein FACS1894189_3510 [Planctomycetales bacterium]